MKTGGLAFVLILGLSMLNGCGGDDTTSPEPDVNEYLARLPRWNEFSPPLASTDEPAGDTEYDATWHNDQLYVCTVTPCSITETPEKVTTFNPGSSILYLGSLIQGNTYLGGLATMEELPIRQRAPLTISIDLLFPDNSRTVADPSLSTVTQAVGELISAAHNAGHIAGSTLDYQERTCYSLSQGMLKMGLSVKYMGFSARTELEFSQTVEQTTVTAFFQQRMFTASVELPQTPGAFFSSDFTREKLNEQIAMGRIGSDNLPVYVSSIVYGRIMVLTMTSSYSAQQMKAALDASYSNVVDVDVQVSAEHLQVLSESEINIAAVGGEAEHALALIRTGNLHEYFASDAALTTAAPISYTLLNLADNSVAQVSETTAYDIVECSTDAVAYYNDFDRWRNAVLLMPNGQVEVLETTAAGVQLANEINVAPSNNGQLNTSQLTFEGVNTGLPLDFNLVALENGGMTFNDDEGFSSSLYPMISIGDANNYEDDDFEITVTRTDPGYTVLAIGTYVGNNGDHTSEFLKVYGESDLLLAEFNSGLPDASGYDFMGVVSAIPISRIYFNEGDGTDDICIQNFTFGVLSE